MSLWTLSALIYCVGFVAFTLLYRRQLGQPPHAITGLHGDAVAVCLGLAWPLVLALSLGMTLAKMARPQGEKASSDE